MFNSKSFRSILTTTIAGAFLIIVGCGGGSGGGSGGDFPTPTLPADAVTFDATNAADNAFLALVFKNTPFSLTGLKTEAPPSIPDFIKLIIEEVIKRGRSSRSVATGVTEDLSAIFCFTGTATATFTENANSETGTIIFSNCDIGGSLVVVDGSLSYDASWNDTTQDYAFSSGGTLTFNDGRPEIFTLVINLSKSGNDGTGDYSSTISYSLSGFPGGGFLVTTPIAWVGNNILLEVYDGQLMIQGANNTRLRITVIPNNQATIELDVGGGDFVEIANSPTNL